MDIRISGHQVETGDALQTLVTDRLQSIASKYFSRAISASVTFGKGPRDHGFTCDIIMHVMQGLVLKASDSGHKVEAVFDGAAERIDKQLRRYTRRLKDRQNGGVAALNEGDTPDEARYTLFREEAEAEEAADAPLIIAETRVDVPVATVSDAVMMLDLRNTNALLFKNLGTGAHNMVYRRGDGTIGWVEPGRAET